MGVSGAVFSGQKNDRSGKIVVGTATGRPAEPLSMPRLKPAERLLCYLTKTQLEDFAMWHDLDRRGTKAEIVKRIVGNVGGDIEDVLTRNSPFTPSIWADAVVKAGGVRQVTFAELRGEAHRTLGTKPKKKKSDQPIEDMTVSQVRRLGLEKALAETYELSLTTVKRKLKGVSGNMKVLNALASSIARVEKRRAAEEEKVARESGPPILLGRYELVSLIGEGGFGTVHEARDLINPARPRVVVKRPLPEPKHEAALVNEILKAHQLRHHNICRYFDFARDDEGRPFLVIEHGGESLDDRFERDGPFSVSEAMEIIWQIADALDYAHSQHVVHGDVNPGNILIDEEDCIRLTDFGISANLVRSRPRGCGRTTLRGTKVYGFHPAYSPPEVVMWHRPRRASDQYSLALVFVSMIKGRFFIKPYKHRSVRVLTKTQNTTIASALSLSPDERFPSCLDFVETLDE
jgi:hypothetical protein